MGADYVHHQIILAPPDFQTFLRPWGESFSEEKFKIYLFQIFKLDFLLRYWYFLEVRMLLQKIILTLPFRRKYHKNLDTENKDNFFCATVTNKELSILEIW